MCGIPIQTANYSYCPVQQSIQNSVNIYASYTVYVVVGENNLLFISKTWHRDPLTSAMFLFLDWAKHGFLLGTNNINHIWSQSNETGVN